MLIQTRFEEAPAPSDSTEHLRAWAMEVIGTPQEHQPGTAVTLEMIRRVLERRGEPLHLSKADSLKKDRTYSGPAKPKSGGLSEADKARAYNQALILVAQDLRRQRQQLNSGQSAAPGTLDDETA